MKNSKENKTISKTKQNVIQNFEHKKYHSQKKQHKKNQTKQ